MKKKYIIMIVIVVVLAGLGLMTGFLKSISGAVVDAETGKPVEGAVVLVEWTRRVGIGDYHTVSVRVSETITGKDGTFYAFGPLHPFVDSPHTVIYKRGYVAWNNEYTFPEDTHRKKTKDLYEMIKLDHFKDSYSHNAHVSFIRTYTRSALASHRKKKMMSAFEWERDLARKEHK